MYYREWISKISGGKFFSMEIEISGGGGMKRLMNGREWLSKISGRKIFFYGNRKTVGGYYSTLLTLSDILIEYE